MPPRLVRRRPFAERLKERLDPRDLLLQLSEELNSDEWQDAVKDWSTAIGVGINFVFLIARVNSGSSSRGDDVFADYERSGSGWWAWFVSLRLLQAQPIW